MRDQVVEEGSNMTVWQRLGLLWRGRHQAWLQEVNSMAVSLLHNRDWAWHAHLCSSKRDRITEGEIVCASKSALFKHLEQDTQQSLCLVPLMPSRRGYACSDTHECNTCIPTIPWLPLPRLGMRWFAHFPPLRSTSSLPTQLLLLLLRHLHLLIAIRVFQTSGNNNSVRQRWGSKSTAAIWQQFVPLWAFSWLKFSVTQTFTLLQYV